MLGSRLSLDRAEWIKWQAWAVQSSLWVDGALAIAEQLKSNLPGVMKDTINMTRFSTVEIDFIADDPGPALLHCHHQDHQDEGFMGLMTYL
jgi:FtsP/CotA-like multicopper oxidase with cupredoxin domain